MRGPNKTAQLQLYSSVLGGEQYLCTKDTEGGLPKGRGCSHTNVQSHQGHHTTGMNRESRAARLQCSFKGEIWSSFSFPKCVAGTTLQFSDVVRKVCSNAAILSVRASQPRVKLWIRRREGLTLGGSTQEEGGKRRTPKDCDRSSKHPQRSREQDSHACPTSSCKDAGLSFPLSPAFKISSKWRFTEFVFSFSQN